MNVISVKVKYGGCVCCGRLLCLVNHNLNWSQFWVLINVYREYFQLHNIFFIFEIMHLTKLLKIYMALLPVLRKLCLKFMMTLGNFKLPMVKATKVWWVWWVVRWISRYAFLFQYFVLSVARIVISFVVVVCIERL